MMLARFCFCMSGRAKQKKKKTFDEEFMTALEELSSNTEKRKPVAEDRPKTLDDIRVVASNGSSSSSMPKGSDVTTVDDHNDSDASSNMTNFDVETVDGVVKTDDSMTAATPLAKMKQKNKEIIEKRATKDDDFEGIRIVILGPCNTGKSTLVKQLQNIFLDGSDPVKVEMYRHLIIDNALQAIKSIFTIMEKEKIYFEDPKHEKCRDMILGIYDSNSIHVIDDDQGSLVLMFQAMYTDRGFLKALKLGPIYHLIESAKYLLDNFGRIFEEDYEPSREDMLMARSSTLAVSKEVVPVEDGLPIKVQDFGGYRFQRLKWYSYFTATIDAIIYVHSLASYNLSVEEDENMNQLEESLAIFEEIANNEVLKQMPLILCLTKKDLFEEKLKVEPFRNFCQEYVAQNAPNPIIEYIKSRFRVLDQKSNRPFYAFVCNPIDKMQSQALLKTVVKIAQKFHESRASTADNRPSK